MKPRSSGILALIPLAALFLVGPAHGVQLGDPRSAVEAELGAPTGEVTAGATTVLFFPRGEIRLRDGKVSVIQLMTEDELAAHQQSEAELKKRLQAEAEERNARLAAEGRALYEAKKKDPAFVDLPTAAQLEYWRSFALRFPMVPVWDEIQTLRARLTEEERIREQEHANELRMQALEARVREAEERAARAEREARNRGGYGFGWWWPHHPGRPHRPKPPHDDHDRPAPREEKSEGRLDQTIDEVRGRIMGEQERVRAEHYRQP